MLFINIPLNTKKWGFLGLKICVKSIGMVESVSLYQADSFKVFQKKIKALILIPNYDRISP